MTGHAFDTTVELTGKSATFFEVPLDVRELFGRARPPLRVTIHGHTYRSTIAVYGDKYYLPLNRENRAAAGVAAGDRIHVTIAPDEEPREIDLPDDLAAALDDEGRAHWDGLSFSHKREYVEWLDDSQRDETRKRRVAKAAAMLRSGERAR